MRVFTRDGVEKDRRALQIEEAEIEQVKKDMRDELRIHEEDIFSRVERLITNKVAEGGPDGLKSGEKVTTNYLQGLSRDRWFEIRMRDEAVNESLEQLAQSIASQREAA